MDLITAKEVKREIKVHVVKAHYTVFNLKCALGIDKVVPVDELRVSRQILLRCYLSRCIFYGSHKFPCRSLLLSTTVLNDICTYVGSNPFELVNVLLENFVNFLLKLCGLV